MFLAILIINFTSQPEEEAEVDDDSDDENGGRAKKSRKKDGDDWFEASSVASGTTAPTTVAAATTVAGAAEEGDEAEPQNAFLARLKVTVSERWREGGRKRHWAADLPPAGSGSADLTCTSFVASFNAHDCR